MNQTTGNFSWIRERHKCSVRAVFAQLQLDVDQDVKERNELRSHQGYEFHVVASDSAFAVVLDDLQTGAGDSVEFSRDGSVIVVKDAKRSEMLRASLTLNDDGECVFLVNNEERNSWQLRKMALEKLFFQGIR